MTDLLPDPPRWRDTADQSSYAERTAGAVVRGLSSIAPLSPRQLVRIKARMASSSCKRWPLRFWATVTAALLLGCATAASAARLGLLPAWLTGEATPKSLQSSPPRIPHGRAKRTSMRSLGSATPSPADEAPWKAPTAAPAQEPEAAPWVPAEPKAAKTAAAAPVPASPPAQVKPARAQQPSQQLEPLRTQPEARHRETWSKDAARTEPHSTSGYEPASPVLPPAWLAAPVERAPGLEAEPPFRQPKQPSPSSPWPTSSGGGGAKPLADAIRALRREHAPAHALALLEAHQADLSRGNLNHEALLVRVEALLALHREPEALRLLDSTPLADVPGWRSLSLSRAELRAAAGRCAAALEDFDLVLAEAPDERAARGRDSCRKRLAEQAKAP